MIGLRQKRSYARLLDDLRVVLAVHKCGSMTRAAVELDTTTSTVSRQIARLRAELCVAPFIKTEGGWLLNPRVKTLIDAFEHADGLIGSELLRLSDCNPEEPREIRIGALPSLISHVLIPALGALHEQNAGLRPVFENRVHEMGLGMSDVAIVYSLPEGGRIKARRCGSLGFTPYAPPDWQHGQGWVSLIDRYTACHAEARIRWFGREASVKVENFSQVVAAMSTLGLAGVLPVVVGEASPDLIRIPGSGLDLERELHLIYHESRTEDADLRIVIDWICRQTMHLPRTQSTDFQKTQRQSCTI